MFAPPRARIAVWLGFIAALSACATFVPGLAGWLVLDRARMADGEFWRLLTHPLVHFSAQHWIIDVAVFTALAWAADRFALVASSGRRGRWLVGLAALALLAVTTGFGALALEPGLDRLGGLSGLNAALATTIGLRLLAAGHWRGGTLVTGAVLAKLLLESMGAAGLVGFESPEIRPLPLVHQLAVLTVLVAAAAASIPRILGRRERITPSTPPASTS